MEKDEFIKLLPQLIREDDTVKGAIISALSGVVATKEDIKEVIAEFDKRFETLIQQMNKGFEEARKDRKSLRTFISTVSSRSGPDLEN